MTAPKPIPSSHVDLLEQPLIASLATTLRRWYATGHGDMVQLRRWAGAFQLRRRPPEGPRHPRPALRGADGGRPAESLSLPPGARAGRGDHRGGRRRAYQLPVASLRGQGLRLAVAAGRCACAIRSSPSMSTRTAKQKVFIVFVATFLPYGQKCAQLADSYRRKGHIMTTSTETVAELLADSDVISQLAGISADSPLGQLRAQRPDIIRYAQSSYLSLLEPTDLARPQPPRARADRAAGGNAHRHARAGRLAPRAPAPAGHQRRYHRGDRGLSRGLPRCPRASGRCSHIQRVALAPAKSTPEDLEVARGCGPERADIVTFSQLITFLSFQARTLIGLRLLGKAL